MPVRDFRTLTTWMKIALVCLTLGLILFVIGFATESWMVSDNRRVSYNAYGLWKFKTCGYRTSCQSYSYTGVQPDFHKATQGLECVALIGMGLALLLLLLYNFMDSCRRREALVCTLLFIFGAVVLSVIGYIVFATKYEEHRWMTVGWSMGVAMAGTILAFVAGIMALMHYCGR